MKIKVKTIGKITYIYNGIEITNFSNLKKTIFVQQFCKGLLLILSTRINLYNLVDTLTRISFLGEEFDIYYEPTETIAELKKRVEEEEGYEPERQKLFWQFFLLEDNSYVEDFLKDGDALTLSLPTATKKPTKLESDKEQFVIHGHSRNFECSLLLPDRPEKIKLKSKKFGVVYHTEGDIGNRVFYVRRYELPKNINKDGTTIQLRSQGNDTKVVLVIDEGPNGEEKNLDEVESKTFRESERTGGMTLKDYLSAGGSIANVFSKTAKGISSFIGL